MRNKSIRRSLSMARLAVLALCFVIVFSMALTLTAKEFSGSASAYTVVNQEKDDDATLGAGSPMYGDSGQLNGTHFGYPGLSNQQTWTYTETYYTIVPSIKNVQVFKVKGDTTMYMHGDEANHWQWGVSNGKASAEVHGIVNFNLTGFLAQMVQNDNVTVKAKVVADIGAREGSPTADNSYVNNLFFSAIGVPAGKTMTGGLSYDLRNNKSESGQDKTGFVTGYQNSDKKGSATRESNEITLDKNTPGLAFALGCGWNIMLWGSHDHYVYMSNLKVVYTITFNGSVTDSETLTLSDNAAPIVSSQYGIENTYNKESSGSGYAPYLTDATKANVYYDSIAKGVKTDSVKDGNGNLASYTNTQISTINGNAYYKFAQTEYVDLYNYSGESSISSALTKYGANAAKVVGAGDRVFSVDDSGNIVATETNDETHLKYASGIKTVKVNDTVFNMWNSADYSQTKAITQENDDGVAVTIGYAKVSRINRSRVIVMLYMTDNGTVQTTISDFGGAENKTSIVVSGIDTQAPSGSISISSENYIGANLSTLDWYRNKSVSADAETSIEEDDSSAGFSPYLWFYTVDKADKNNNFATKREFANYQAVKDAGILPIAYSGISSFDYDFSTGLAKAYGGATQGNPSDMAAATGAGYYRFTFYTFDLAGNKGGEYTIFMKVDYEDVDYTIDFKYDKNGTPISISASDNGAWATGDITLKLFVNNKVQEGVRLSGFSGYTLSFDVDGVYHALVVDGFGDTQNASGDGLTYVSKFVKYISSNGAQAVEGNQITIDVKTSIGTLPVVISYSDDGVNGGVFTISIAKKNKTNFAWITQFNTYTGQYTSINTIQDMDGHANAAWGAGVNILLDSTNPENPIMGDSDDAEASYLGTLNDFTSLPTNRVWYTGALKSYAANIAFNDDIVNSDYASNIKVYCAFNIVKNLAELQTLGANNIEAKIILGEAKESDFNKMIAINGDSFDGGNTDFVVDLISGQDAGMRVFYVWAEDQAGNKSGVTTYYVLADPTPYTVSASIKANAAFEKGSANFTFLNENGDSTTTFKRGEKVVFSVGFNDGYVPYYFTLNGNKLLENYTPQRVWSAVAGDNASLINTDGTNVEYTIDDAQSLAKLDTKQSFELAHRKVVSYTLASRRVNYTSEKTDVLAQTVFGDLALKAAFEVRFMTGDAILYADIDGNPVTDIANAAIVDGKPVYYVPTKVGTYSVALYIDKNNDTYVTDDFDMNADGSQKLNPVSYEIIKGIATISATPTTSVYGNKIVLDYTLSGISQDKLAIEGIAISLALKVSDFDANAKYAVGTYQIVCTSNFADVANYDVVFESAIHTITQRDVNVYAWGATKAYKEADPELMFGVKLEDFGVDASSILDEIFAGYRKAENQTVDSVEYALYYADGRLTRESGETAQKYSYLNTASKFDVNSNFRVVLQRNNVFEITQRIVKLDVSGQSSVYAYVTDIASLLAGIAPSYKLGSGDMIIADEIAALVGGLSLDVDSAAVLDAGDYDSATGYNILLDSASNNNIKVVLDTEKGVQYVVYVTAQNTIVIKAKAGVLFESVYGLVNGANFALDFSSDKFEIVGTASGEYTSVVWSASISAGAGLANAGNYIVTFADAKLYNGDTALADKVVVEQVVYTVKPAQIVVKPIVGNLAKTYGEDDSVYGIDFTIQTIAGLSVDEIATLTGLSQEELKGIVTGAYARAIYDNNGNRVAFATRYDSATENNVIIGTNGRYYGIEIGTAFASNNNNFTVQAMLDNSIRLAINKKALTLNTKDFVGVSKYYDGTTDVHYGSNALYNIASLLVLASDDVKLTADAVYNLAGSPTANTTANITFSNLALEGSDAHNYVLVAINNDGNNVSVENYDGAITQDVSVRIYWIDNENGVEQIAIKMGFIAVRKSDVVVSKQYDNTTDLYASNVSFKDVEGTRMIAGNKGMTIIASESGVFAGVDVSSNYLISTLALFFPFDSESINGIDVRVDGEYQDDDVTITKTIYNGVDGVKIVISKVPAQIVQRVLNANSFETITAVDREYNSTTDVDINYELSQGALVAGDTIKTVGLLLKGKVEDKNAGTHTVSIESASVTDSNYTVDLASINSRFNVVEVEISKASLVPVVTFDKKSYDGTASLSVSSNTGKFTAAYAKNLATELEWLSYDASKVDFVLALNGVEDANVQANGLHNVLVSGLEVKFAEGLSDAQRAELARNYKLSGSRYSAQDKKYVEITDISEGLAADYELIDAAELAKKEIVLTTNDFKIKDKIYDGTNNADITIDIAKDVEGNDRLVAGHETMLEVTASGTFASRFVGDNIKVDIDRNSVVLRVKAGTEGASIIGNYELVLNYNAQTVGKIKARPVALEVNLGEQEYSSQENVKESAGLSYTLDGVLGRDKLTVSTINGAYYDDKNVNVDAEGNVIAKSGTAYGVTLNNIGNTNNYKAVYKSNIELAGKSYVAYVTTSGDWRFQSSVDALDAGQVAYYCYNLETTQKYILAASLEKVEAANAANAIVGFNIIGGKDVYMVTSDYSGDTDGALDEAMTYLHGEGKITKRTVYINAGGIQMVSGSSAFTKTYDGTTKFYGVQGVDYAITASAVGNVYEGDDVTIMNVSAEYENSTSGSAFVVFTVSGIDGAAVDNYTMEGNTSKKVRLPGKITQLTIDAKLNDASIEYGSTDIPSNITYTIGGKELVKGSGLGNTFYMNFNDFVTAVGLDATTDAKYVESLYARTYNLVDGEYVKANAGEQGEYIIIGGRNDAITTLPKASATFTSVRPVAGTVATSYKLTDGKATNYVFDAEYTNGKNSVLTVEKKTVYIVTETKDFAKTYGSANPQLKIYVLDKNGADGLVSNEQWNTLFKKGSIDIGPIVKLGVFNSASGTITEATALAVTSDKLGANESYVFYLDTPNGEDYATSVDNYNIVFAGKDSVIVNSEGKATYKLAGANFTRVASTLNISLPGVSGVSVAANDENVFTYKKDYNWINEVLRGELATDEVRFLMDGVEVEAINAGVYEGVIILKRYINANGDFVSEQEKDANGYFIEWNSGDVKVKITVNKQTINIWADGMSVYYNGSEQSYSESKIGYDEIKDETGKTQLVNGTDYTMSYEVYDNQSKTYVKTNSTENAGRYRVSIAFNDAFETNHPNLAKGKSVSADFYILKAIVNVSISTDGFDGGSEMVNNSRVVSLRTDYKSDKVYDIVYSVEMDAKCDDPSVEITKDQTKVVLTRNGKQMSLAEINDAGKYTFAIVLADDSLDANNYTINGGAGTLELTVNKLNGANGGSIDLGDSSITANRLVITEVKNGSTLATDAAYLATIEKHVATLSKQAGYEENARIAAVYRVALYCDDKLVAPDSKITVSIAMPDGIDSMDGIVVYTVTEDGALQKVSNYGVDGKNIVIREQDHVSGIVFVDTNAAPIDAWKLYVIIAVAAFVALIVIMTLVGVAIRKSQLKKLDC